MITATVRNHKLKDKQICQQSDKRGPIQIGIKISGRIFL